MISKRFTVEELVDEGVLAKPIDGNHGSIHPKTTDFKKSGIPFVMASDIENGEINYENCAFIDQKTRDGLQKGFAKPGDVLLSHKATIGRVAVVDRTYDEIVLTPQLTYYRVLEPEILSNEYLKYYFLSPDFQALFKQWAGDGSTRSYLGITAQRKLPIIIPDIDTQKRIVNILSYLDQKIDLNRKMNETLEQMGQSLFKHYFVDNPENKDWREATIGEYFDIVLGGTPSRNRPEYWGGTDIGWINSGAVNQFRITTPSEYITNEGLEKSATKILPSGTTVLAITGATLGQVSRLEQEFAANQSVVGIHSTDTNLNDFFYYWVTLNIADITRHGTGGAQQHINKGDVENTHFKLPPKNLLKEHGGELKNLLSKISGNVKQMDVLVELRDSLLPRLIDGRIIV